MPAEATTEPADSPKPVPKSPLAGEVFHLDRFRGFGLGSTLEWKPGPHRMIAVMIGLEANDSLDRDLTAEQALAKLGYVRAGSPAATPTSDPTPTDAPARAGGKSGVASR